MPTHDDDHREDEEDDGADVVEDHGPGTLASARRRRPPRHDLTMTDSLSGRLLIAGPSLGDPNFDRTIVYVARAQRRRRPRRGAEPAERVRRGRRAAAVVDGHRAAPRRVQRRPGRCRRRARAWPGCARPIDCPGWSARARGHRVGRPGAWTPRPSRPASRWPACSSGYAGLGRWASSTRRSPPGAWFVHRRRTRRRVHHRPRAAVGRDPAPRRGPLGHGRDEPELELTIAGSCDHRSIRTRPDPQEPGRAAGAQAARQGPVETAASCGPASSGVSSDVASA